MHDKFIARHDFRELAERALASDHPQIIAIYGPRQVGKTTLGRQIVPDARQRFDLESPVDLDRLGPSLKRFGLLSSLNGRVLIDEVQQIPEIFAELRVIVDEPTCRARFVLTGSQ